MNEPQIEKILRHTLKDYRLSRGEKRVLSSILDETGVDEHDLGVLRHQAFEIARGELLTADAKDVLQWLESVVKVLLPKSETAVPDSRVFFSPGDDCLRRIVGLLTFAQSKVDICVFTITDDRISDAILEAHRRKVQLRIITDNDKSADRGSDISRLQQRGVPVRVDESEYHMHHKFAVFDAKTTLTGSYNWTRSAARHNEENLLVTTDPSVVRAYANAFEELWRKLN